MAVESKAPPDPEVADTFDYPVGTAGADGRVSGADWFVSQDFADVENAYSERLSGQHLGEDWLLLHKYRDNGSFAGLPVRAIARGIVIVAGRNHSLGNVVLIRHPLPAGSHPSYVISLYGHLGPDLPVCAGKWVERGTVIGVIGKRGENGVSKSGSLWPEHLHFELRGDKSQTGFDDDTIAVGGSIGYAPKHDGFLNPTDATSEGGEAGDGWIDAHRN